MVLQIYKEWANHYLDRIYSKRNQNERSPFGNKRYIDNITTDLKDGVLLLDIIEAVTCTRIISQKMHRRPVTIEQMIQNIDLSLNHLKCLKVNVDGITSSDIYNGNLKSILNLFYNLSRYKETLKQEKSLSKVEQIPSNSKLSQFQPNSKRYVKAPTTAVSSNGVQPSQTLMFNGIASPSRLPQKHDSKKPGSGSQVGPVAHIKRLPSLVSKQILRPPSRSNSPSSIISKSSSTSQTSLTPSQTSNSPPEARGIRPPRPSSIPTAPNPGAATGSKSLQPKTISGKSLQFPSQVRKEIQVSAKEDSNSGSVSHYQQQRQPHQQLNRSLGSGPVFTSSKCDSTHSLTETETKSNTKTASIKQIPVNKRNIGIPAPKSRPNSACYNNPNLPPNLNQIIQSNVSISRPLSSLGMPKGGLAPVREASFNKEAEDSATERTHDNKQNQLLRPEPNVARVSPIRRQPDSSNCIREVTSESQMQQCDYDCRLAISNRSEPSSPRIEAGPTSFAPTEEEQSHRHSKSSNSNTLTDSSSLSSRILALGTLRGQPSAGSTTSRHDVEDTAYSDTECIRKHVKCLSSEGGSCSSHTPFNSICGSRDFPKTLEFFKDGHTLADRRNFLSSSPSPTPSCYTPKRSTKQELRGSCTSIGSLMSSCSNPSEERYQQEIKKLKAALMRSTEKVAFLTSQLNTNAQMIAAFEQSLESLTRRLHQYSVTTEQKDREIMRLKSTIEALRKECQNGCPLSSIGSESDTENSKKKQKDQKSSPGDKEESSGWFRGSISRAFKKNRSRQKSGGSASDVEGSDTCSVPGTPVLSPKNSISSKIPEEQELEIVQELKKQLMEKEKLLTNMRLELLSISHQMENMKDLPNKTAETEMADEPKGKAMVTTTEEVQKDPLLNALIQLQEAL